MSSPSPTPPPVPDEVADFLVFYDEFSQLPVPKIQVALQLATAVVNKVGGVATWDIFYVNAIHALAAHELSISYHEQLSLGINLAAIEEVKAITLKDRNNKDYYKLTSYGLKYLQLLKRIKPATMRVI